LLCASVPAARAEDSLQLIEQIQDWVVGCTAAQADKAARCELFQQVALRDTRQPVFRLAFRLTDAGAVEALITAPFGVLLRPGITYSIDGGDRFASDILACFPSGCLSRFVVPPDIEAALGQGAALLCEMQIYEGDVFRVDLKLPGYAQGIARLRALAQQ